MFNPVVSFLVFKDCSLDTISNLKNTCKSNLIMLSGLFKNHTKDMKKVFECALTCDHTIGDKYKDMKSYIVGSHLLDNPTFEPFMSDFIKLLTDNMIEKSIKSVDSTDFLANIDKAWVNVEISKLFQNENLFNFLETHGMSKQLAETVCQQMIDTNNLKEINNILEFIKKHFDQSFHAQAAKNMLETVYEAYLIMILDTVKNLVEEGHSYEAQKDLAASTFKSFFSEDHGQAILDLEFLLKQRFPKMRHTPFEQRFMNDLSEKIKEEQIFDETKTIENIFEMAYEAYLNSIKNEFNQLPIQNAEELEQIKNEIKNASADDLFQTEKGESLLALEESLKGPNHVSVKERILKDLLEISKDLSIKTD